MAGVTLFLLAACGTALLGAAYLQGGEDLVKRVIDAQAARRMVDDRESYLFYWYRCLSSCAVSYPLAILVVAARFRRILRRETRDDTFLGYMACWVLIVLIGMSVPAAKKARYILPIVPALALAASCVFIDLSLKGVLAETRKAVIRICSFIPLSASVAAVGFLVFGRLFRFHADIYSVVAAGLLTGLAVIVWAARRRLKSYPNGDMALMAAAVAAFIIIDAGIVEPVEIGRQRTTPFAEKVLSLQQERPGEVVFYRIGPDGEDIKFMVNYDRPVTPVFVKSPEELLGRQKDSYFIAGKQDFEQLPEAIKKQMKLCFQGRIGHKDCVVFILQQSELHKADGMPPATREAASASAARKSKR
jgi:4-amino-4-deoxy-L-arabinose transferase-like glycosyltransferase